SVFILSTLPCLASHFFEWSSFSLSFYCSRDHPDLHSFPTRRSSDLKRFSDDNYIYGKAPNEFIRSKSAILPEQAKVGCFAEGEGRNAVYLARLGHEVTAYDQSQTGLEKTKLLASEHDVSV